MPESLTVLGIESSCDETAVAILRSAGEGKAPEILSSIISSQIAIHRRHGGVVPELASRNHSADLPGVIRAACREAGVTPADIDVFGATGGPGLVAALLVGNSTAKALALATGKPFVSVNHLEGHLLSPFLKRPGGPVPHLGMVVSGGHTLFVDVRGVGDYHLLGRSLDDAAGEAFDKVGKMLGLPYPGGPEIDRMAAHGDPQAFSFPRALMKEHTANVSFSGLKTAVLYPPQAGGKRRPSRPAGTDPARSLRLLPACRDGRTDSQGAACPARFRPPHPFRFRRRLLQRGTALPPESRLRP